MRYNKAGEAGAMEKTTTMNLRVNPTVKQQAEDVLKQLGVPMATAVDMFLRQIALTGSIPFAIALPKAPDSVDADNMTASQLREAIQAGLDDAEFGNMQDAGAAFARFRKQHA